MTYLPQIILAGFLASIIWFMVASVLYLNPKVFKMYKRAEKRIKIRWWKDTKEMLRLSYISILIQSLLAAYVFTLIKSSLGDSFAVKVLLFGLIIFLIKIIPRFLDMWRETNYPMNLLILELIDDTFCGFLMSLIIVAVIG